MQDALVMRPLFHPDVPLTWRDLSTLQIGLPPAPTCVLEGATTQTHQLIRSLDGQRLATEIDDPDLVGVLEALRAAHALIDVDAVSASNLKLTQGQRQRQRVRVRQLSRNSPRPDWGERATRIRAESYIEVRGANPLASAIATSLAAAGVGRVVIDANDHLSIRVTPGSLSSGGLNWSQVGQPLILATRNVLAEFGAETIRPRGLPKPDCEIFTYWPSDEERDRLNGEEITHAVSFIEGPVAIVGPLVLPGCTPCLRCDELATSRTSSDWAQVKMHRSTSRGSESSAFDPMLLNWAAATLSLGVLTQLESGETAQQSSLAGQKLTLHGVGPGLHTERLAFEPTCGCT